MQILQQLAVGKIPTLWHQFIADSSIERIKKSSKRFIYVLKRFSLEEIDNNDNNLCYKEYSLSKWTLELSCVKKNRICYARIHE